jgi:hypothetical protein
MLRGIARALLGKAAIDAIARRAVDLVLDAVARAAARTQTELDDRAIAAIDRDALAKRIADLF